MVCCCAYACTLMRVQTRACAMPLHTYIQGPFTAAALGLAWTLCQSPSLHAILSLPLQTTFTGRQPQALPPVQCQHIAGAPTAWQHGKPATQRCRGQSPAKGLPHSEADPTNATPTPVATHCACHSLAALSAQRPLSASYSALKRAPSPGAAHLQLANNHTQPAHLQLANNHTQPAHLQLANNHTQPAHLQLATCSAKPPHIQPATRRVPLTYVQHATHRSFPKHDGPCSAHLWMMGRAAGAAHLQYALHTIQHLCLRPEERQI